MPSDNLLQLLNECIEEAETVTLVSKLQTLRDFWVARDYAKNSDYSHHLVKGILFLILAECDSVVPTRTDEIVTIKKKNLENAVHNIVDLFIKE